MSKITEDMRNEAAVETNVLAIQNIMEALSIDAEKAMDMLEIPASERPAYAARL